MSDTEYCFSGKSSKDRRKKQRKKTDTHVPVEVKIVGDDKPDYLKFPKDASKQQQSRKKPGHDIKVAYFHEMIGEGFLVDLSPSGLKMRGKFRFQKGQKLNLSFLIPNVLAGHQIPVFAICEVIWSEFKAGEYYTGLNISFMLSEHADFFNLFLDQLPAAKCLSS